MSNNPKNPYLIDVSNDFGFTAIEDDPTEIKQQLEIDRSKHTYQKNALETKIKDYEMRLEAIQKIYLPLLESLAKDPEKPFIKWPNRKEVIEKHIQKMIQLTDVS